MKKDPITEEVRNRVEEKIFQLTKMIRELRAGNNEQKSSMGDKYETSREMLAQEVGNLQRQVKQWEIQKRSIEKLSSDDSLVVELGAVVETDLGIFYLATSVGELNFKGQSVVSISLDAPIAIAMLGKRKGDKFEMRGKSLSIKNIW